MAEKVRAILIIYGMALIGWAILRVQDEILETDGRFGYTVVAVVACIFFTLSILCGFPQ